MRSISCAFLMGMRGRRFIRGVFSGRIVGGAVSREGANLASDFIGAKIRKGWASLRDFDA